MDKVYEIIREKKIKNKKEKAKHIIIKAGMNMNSRLAKKSGKEITHNNRNMTFKVKLALKFIGLFTTAEKLSIVVYILQETVRD